MASNEIHHVRHQHSLTIYHGISYFLLVYIYLPTHPHTLPHFNSVSLCLLQKLEVVCPVCREALACDVDNLLSSPAPAAPEVKVQMNHDLSLGRHCWISATRGHCWQDGCVRGENHRELSLDLSAAYKIRAQSIMCICDYILKM